MSQIQGFKRIVVCCDGTWMDGLAQTRTAYTNVLRLARTINHKDGRHSPEIPQIVFYQSGVGTDKNMYSKYVEGTTGDTLGDKVEEAYGFIAHNYNPGDEIFLFGFSRGAYTARMVAMFIGAIGVLGRRDMDNFSAIFVNFQNLGKATDPKQRLELEKKLAPWRDDNSNGKKRVKRAGSPFTIKCIGVWDTVGSVGLPDEILTKNKDTCPFGFPDRNLGAHVERAYQALALNETRANFVCNKFEQTDAGRRNNQTLQQCWFSGAHCDIGGGYDQHDLADLTLIWMCALIGDALSLDLEYLNKIFQPIAPWGHQQPHNSDTGVFLLGGTVKRPMPTQANDPKTHETIHSSVMQQASVSPVVTGLLKSFPNIVAAPLLPFEEEMKAKWPYDPNSPASLEYEKKKSQAKAPAQLASGIVPALERVFKF